MGAGVGSGLESQGRAGGCAPCRLSAGPPGEHALRTPLPLINGGRVCTLTPRQSASGPGTAQVWLIYSQVRTGRSLKTAPDLLSFLNSTPPRPAPGTGSCLSPGGRASLSLGGGPVCFASLGCVSISELMEAMCLLDGKTPTLASEGARRVLP